MKAPSACWSMRSAMSSKLTKTRSRVLPKPCRALPARWCGECTSSPGACFWRSTLTGWWILATSPSRKRTGNFAFDSSRPRRGAENRKESGMTSMRGKTTAKLSPQQIYDYCAQINAIGRAQPVSVYDMNGIVLDVNENFESLLGYGREVIGNHLSLFVDELERQTPQYQAAMKELWERLNRGEVCDGEAKRSTKQGKEIWIHYSYNPVLDRKGKPYKVINYFRDVTQRRLALADQAGQIAAIGK